MASCPNINSPEFKALESVHGREKATLLFHMNNELIPTVEEAQNLTSKSGKSDIFFQLPSAQDQGTIAELEEKMMSFVKGLNFDVDAFEELKEVTGFDAISAVDLINKVVLYSQGAGLENVAKETAYVAYAMLGKKNKIVTDLRHSITEIDNYDQIFAEYAKRSPNLTEGKINELIVIDFLADAIKNNFEMPKDSYINRKSEYWSISGNSALEKRIKYYLSKFLQELKKLLRVSKLSKQEIVDLANDIANDILTANYQKYQTELAPGQQEVNYEDTIKKDPKAKEIIENFQNLGIVPTGSLSLRRQGKLYRTNEENVHDLDFSVPFELVKDDIEKSTNHYEKALLNAGIAMPGVKMSNRQNLQQIYRDLAIVKQIKKLYPDFKIQNTFTGDKGLLTITGKIGNHSIDLFVIDAPDSFVNEGGFQNWQSIFSAKIMMGRAKDLLDFLHWKPFNINKSGKFAEMPGLRHFSFNQTNLVTEQQQAADEELNKIIEGFIATLGGTITYTDEIIINGERIDVNAVADVIRKAIQVANGKAGIDTLPEEAAHIFVQWLPKNSALRKQLLADIRKRPEYKKVMRNYKNNPAYQNEDGTVNEEKIAIETAGQILAGAIVGRYKDSKTMNFFQRFMRWIKELLAGKDLDAYQVAAKQILSGSTRKLDLTQKFDGEEYYYQRTPEYVKYVEKIAKKGTEDAQQIVIDKVFLNPDNLVELTADGTFKDKDGKVYTSAQSLINGNAAPTTISPEWEEQFHKILEGVLQNKLLSEIETVYTPGTLVPVVGSTVMESLYRDIAEFKGTITADGSIALAQVVMATPSSDDSTERIATTVSILLVHRNGELTPIDLKVSDEKIKATDTTYRLSYITARAGAPGSVLVNDQNKPLDISERTKQSVQVGTSSKIGTINGFTMRKPMTKNFYVKAKDNVVFTYEDEGLVEHASSESRDLVDKVVPIEPSGKKIDTGNILDDEEPMTDDEMAAAEEKQKRDIQEAIVLLTAQTKSFKEYLEDRSRGTVEGEFKATIETMDTLLADVNTQLDAGADYSTIYTVFLQSTRDQLTKLLGVLSYRDGAGDLVAASDPKYFGQLIAMTAVYLKNFEGLYLIKDVGTGYQHKLFKQVDQLLRDTSTAVISAHEYMADKVLYNSSTNQAVKNEINKSRWKGLVYKSGLKTIKDMTLVQKELGSLGGNVIADIAQKELSLAKERARENAEAIVERINDAANKLRAAGVDNYNFMKQIDADGKWNGKMVGNVGPNYYRLRAAAEEGIFDPVTKEFYKYKKVSNIATASAKDIAYNKALWLRKQAYRRFMNAETVTADPVTNTVTIDDGEYHKYTDAFKAERDKYMYLEVYWNGFTTWVFKDVSSISQEMKDKLAKEYPKVSLEKAWNTERNKWRDNNYNYASYTTMVKDRDGRLTGETREVTGDAAWFPSPQHVEPRVISSNGTKLASDKYIKLMNPTTDAERAQSEYYNTYTEIMQDMLLKLPAYASYWFEQGNVPFIEANLMNRLSEEGADKMNILLGQIGTMVPTAYFKDRGEVEAKKSLPVAFMNGVQDVQRLQFLEKELEILVSKKDQMSPLSYQKRHDQITDALNKERGKMAASKFHGDLTDGLVAFAGMAETYDALSQVETILQSLEKKVESVEFVQDLGVLTKGQRRVSGLESRTRERIKWFMDNEFYSNEYFDKTFGDWFVKKLMVGTSIMSIGVNVTGMINNAFIASLNNNIESIGSDFFKRGSYVKIAGLFVTEFMPGYVKTVGQHSSRDKSKAYYGSKKAGSKIEALTTDFNMINQEHKRPGGDSWMGKFFGVLGFGGYEAGEYMVQSKVGNAVLDSIMIKGYMVDDQGQFILDKNGQKIENVELSIYDAYDFDENTGKATFKPGYSITKEEKYSITHKIWKVNERIHGNYRWKVMLERYVVGQMVLQFHKWIFPNFLQRFEKAKFNEALGMETEGRYITLGKFIWSLKELKSRTEAWDKLTPLQKNNLKKDLADALFVCALGAMYYILKKISKGIPDDDPYIKKMVNWLSKEADRGSQELSIFIPGWGFIESWRLVKNPIAVTSSIGKFVTLLTDATMFPFGDDEDRYYQRGVFSGELKVKKDLYDIIPVLKLVNEWNRLDQQTNFFIN
jgi:hypothetical protein